MQDMGAVAYAPAAISPLIEDVFLIRHISMCQSQALLSQSCPLNHLKCQYFVNLIGVGSALFFSPLHEIYFLQITNVFVFEKLCDRCEPIQIVPE